MIFQREKTKKVMVGNVEIGGNNRVVIQSMTTTKTKNVDDTVSQILELEKAGCELVRVAVLDKQDAEAIKDIKMQTNIPLVADIHFDYELALIAVENGIDKIRINPGNIGSEDKVELVVKACKAKNIPIRIGVNAGSLEKHILEQYGFPTAEGMVASAKYHVELLEKFGFEDIIISLKASNIRLTIDAYRLAAKTFKYPLHLGVTEAGTKFSGTIKSSIGLGILLEEQIGSTMRVSLSANPVEEIRVCKEILKNFGLANNIANLISCPTCGRLQYNLIALAEKVEEFLETIPYNINVAVMGCAVNGPGEARKADIGIAGGKGEGLLFSKGEIIRKVKEEDMFEALKEEVYNFIKNNPK